MVHEGMRTMISGYRQDAHPMELLVGLVGSLSTFYHDSLDISPASTASNPRLSLLKCPR